MAVFSGHWWGEWRSLSNKESRKHTWVNRELKAFCDSWHFHIPSYFGLLTLWDFRSRNYLFYERFFWWREEQRLWLGSSWTFHRINISILSLQLQVKMSTNKGPHRKSVRRGIRGAMRKKTPIPSISTKPYRIQPSVYQTELNTAKEIFPTSSSTCLGGRESLTKFLLVILWLKRCPDRNR